MSLISEQQTIVAQDPPLLRLEPRSWKQSSLIPRKQALPRPARASSSPFVTVGNQTPVLFRPAFLTASLQPRRPGRCHGNAKQNGYENVGYCLLYTSDAA